MRENKQLLSYSIDHRDIKGIEKHTCGYEVDITKHEQKIQKSERRNINSYVNMALGYQVAGPEPATINNKTKWMEDEERNRN